MRILSQAALLACFVMLGQTATAQSLPPASAVMLPVMEGLPDYLAYVDAAVASPINSTAQFQIYAGQRRWQTGQTLRICFFGGGGAVRTLIAQTAGRWLPYVNLKFDFGDMTTGYRSCNSSTAGFNEIKIGFSEPGYFSLVGTDSTAQASALQPSMNLANFQIRYMDGVYNPAMVTAQANPNDVGIILHEFGHALGLLHEAQSPAMDCISHLKKTGPGNIYESLAQAPNYWDAATVDRNLAVAIKKTDPDYVAGQPDPTSVMMYKLAQQLFVQGTNPGCIAGGSNKISEKDKQIVAQLYPLGATVVIASNDAGISKGAFAAIPAGAPEGLTADYQTRLIADLENDDALVRRDARARLAQYVAGDSSRAAALVEGIANKSYRYQLGVAVALEKAGPAAVSTGIKATLRTLFKTTKDKTLRDNLNALQK